MTIADIIALAKQGYKPGDIKELISLAEETETKQTSTEENENNNSDDIQNIEQTQPEEKEDNKGNSEKEEALKEIERLKAQIADIQKQNRNLDMSNNINNKTIDEQIVDIFTSIL